MAHYSPLSVPSSPIMFQFSPSAHNSIITPSQSQLQTRSHVMEVPVPVYLPMLGKPQRNTYRSASSPNMMRTISLPQLMPQQETPQREQPSSSGHVAIVYYHTPEQESSSSNVQEQSEPVPQPDSDGTGFVRIMLRPKLSISSPMAVPIGQPSPLSRIAYHRRIDDSEEDQVNNQASPMLGHDMIDGPRLRQWRDYSQFVRSAPAPLPTTAPVGHLLIAAHRSEDPEPASSQDFYQHQQPQAAAFVQASSPFSYTAESQSAQSAAAPQQSHHIFMAPHSAPSAFQHPVQAQQQTQGPPASSHATFFILAEPHGAQQEGNNEA